MVSLVIELIRSSFFCTEMISQGGNLAEMQGKGGNESDKHRLKVGSITTHSIRHN